MSNKELYFNKDCTSVGISGSLPVLFIKAEKEEKQEGHEAWEESRENGKEAYR